MAAPIPPVEGSNFRFAKFFLEKPRLTLLALLLLLTVGIVSSLSLKTTGFPNISIPAILIQTTYPGAASDTVAADITIPIEGKIKDIDGVQSYSSESSNSFSTVSLTLNSTANADTVSSKITAALQGLKLPTGSQTPKIQSLQFTGPTFRISIADHDLSKIYAIETKIKKDLGQNQDTTSVTAVNELTPQITVTIDPAKLANTGISQLDIQTALHSLGATIPIASDISLENYSQTVSVALSGTSLDSVRNLPLKPATRLGQPTQAIIPLSQLASTKLEYRFATEPTPVLGYHSNTSNGTLPALTLVIRSTKGVDTHAYSKQVRALLSSYPATQYVISDPVADNQNVQIVEQYSADTDNQHQVKEVTRGLIGGSLPLSNKTASQVGWLLGGIQLVFLVMMALVSWRAALVSSLAIPLSLLFSSIYLNLTGNSFNTIVLFSLVLAIGLVVDPALVVLEAVQRKVDAGFKGNQAVLLAVKDVGAGLFIATLNNIIVFLPFGIVSGAIGQIFANIPAAIIPAIVGSYIVPLLFLGWLGGIILRPGKHTSSNEEENLWPFAKWLIQFNQAILDGSVLRRVIIIGLAALIPVAVAGYYFASGKITFTQFSGGGAGTYIDISGTYKGDLPKEERQLVTQGILNKISQNPHLGTIYAIGNNFTYEAYVKQGDSYPTSSLRDDIIHVLDTYKDRFFDVQASILSTAGPEAGYQVQIAIASEDPIKLETAAKSIGAVLATACLEDKKSASLSNSCGGSSLITKVDDGYTGKVNRGVQVLLDRDRLINVGLDPAGGQVIGVLSQLFPSTQPQSSGSLLIDGRQVDIYLASNSITPNTVAGIKAIPLISSSGARLTLGDVASVVEKTSSATINRQKGQTQTIVRARLAAGHTDQSVAAQVTNAVVTYYNENNAAKTTALGLQSGAISSYSQGGSADFAKSFTQLLEALVLAIFATYVILVIFFDSFLQPLVILFTIPLTFIGIFPALAYLGTKQFGFFEIIGMIILVGLVDNVAIFLIDAARQRIVEGVQPKIAIAHASGIRLRPVILTKAVALASLAPLAILSPFYRSISLVIMFGLLTSGLTSLFTTPILFIFFRWLSERFTRMNTWNKLGFILFSIPYLLVLGYIHRKESLHAKL